MTNQTIRGRITFSQLSNITEELPIPYAWIPGHQKNRIETYSEFIQPVNDSLPNLALITSGYNRSLQMTFEDQINILVHFHLEEHHLVCHLPHVLKESDFARQYIAPENGVQKNSFFEDEEISPHEPE